MTLAALIDFKRSRFADIDLRTQEVLARGFTYGGVNVSLSVDAQVRYEALRTMSGLFSSVTIEAADDMNPSLTLVSLNIGAFTDAMRVHVRGIYDTANALKKSIREATDYAGVEAVVDTR